MRLREIILEVIAEIKKLGKTLKNFKDKNLREGHYLEIGGQLFFKQK